MTRKAKTAPETRVAYRVLPGKLCVHRGVEYHPGDLLPALPISLINVHLPCVEVIEIPVDDEPEEEIVIDAVLETAPDYIDIDL
jgi:hypothetical protein